MRNAQFLLLFLVSLLLSSCDVNQELIGLWQIERVKVGSQEMTPIAKWTRINSDSSQESGNGWFQHTIGHWVYDAKNKEIKLTNTNGVKDEFGGFAVVSNDKDQMIWKREEEGEKVQVFLKRIEEIPASPANQLLGIWKLRKGDVNESPDAISYIFLRWDQIVVKQRLGQMKQYGVYKTHAHKNEVQIIYYEDPLRQEVWRYNFVEDNELRLEGEVNGERIVLEYERIDYFPTQK